MQRSALRTGCAAHSGKFTSFQSGEFTQATMIYPLDEKLVKSTYVQQQAPSSFSSQLAAVVWQAA